LGLLLNSGNDAANVLARVGGGSGGVPATLDAMNAEAKHLGAADTHAVTPSGLDGPGQFTSAYDLALIARECFTRDDFRRYTAAPRAQIPPQPPKDPRGFQIQNENLLLTNYPGALGGKTGFTDLARHTYVGVAERNGRRLAVTLLGAEHQPIRAWQQGAALLDWGFGLPADASVGKLVKPGEVEAAEKGAAAKANGSGKTGAGRENHFGPARGDVTKSLAAWSPAAVGGATFTVLAVPVLLIVGRRRRRRRRA
jgi:D-alanyl-D-alanine carboxypeptidase (penicillin-binding protein 5/6)